MCLDLAQPGHWLSEDHIKTSKREVRGNVSAKTLVWQKHQKGKKLKLANNILKENSNEMFCEIPQQIWMQELRPHLSLKVFRLPDNVGKIYMESIFRKFSKEQNYTKLC